MPQLVLSSSSSVFRGRNAAHSPVLTVGQKLGLKKEAKVTRRPGLQWAPCGNSCLHSGAKGAAAPGTLP